MKSGLLVLLFAVPALAALHAQPAVRHKLSGRVVTVNATGTPPISGAGITAKWAGGSDEIASDGNGAYFLSAPDKAEVTVLFEYVGYLPFSRKLVMDGPQTCDGFLLEENQTVAYWRAAGAAISRAGLSDNAVKQFWEGAVASQLPLTAKVAIAGQLNQRPAVGRLVPDVRKYAAEDPLDVQRLAEFFTLKVVRDGSVPKPAEIAAEKLKFVSGDTISELSGQLAAASDPEAAKRILESHKSTWGAPSYLKAVKAAEHWKVMDPRFKDHLVYLPKENLKIDPNMNRPNG